MKKVTVIFGILTALFVVAGVCFKNLHWPGAAIALITGIGLFLTVFLILLTIQKCKGASGIEKTMHIIKHIAYMDLAVAVLFAINHYPGTFIMMVFGCAVFIIGYLPLSYKVHKAKHPEENALNKVMMSLIILALVFGYGNRNMSHRIFEMLSNADLQVTTMTAAADTTTNQVMVDFEMNKNQFPAQVHPKYLKALKIQHLSDSLVDFLNTCKQEAAALCGSEDIKGLTLEQIPGMWYYSEASNYFVGTEPTGKSGKAFEIRQRIEALNDSLNAIMKPDSGIVLSVPVYMGPYNDKDNNEEVNWEISMFYHSMLIDDLAYLDVLILAVKQTESQLISSLLSDARSEAMWSFWNKYKELYPDQNTK